MSGSEHLLRRIVYTSVPSGTHFRDDRDNILSQSRNNNGMDGLTGVLWSSPTRYVHVLEGPPEAVAATSARIMADGRHRNIEMLSDTMEPERLFGSWTMAGLPGTSPVVLHRLLDLLGSLPSQRAGEVADAIAAAMSTA